MKTFIPSHADVGYLVGVPVRETLRTEGNIEAALNSAYAIDSRMYFKSNIKEYETDFLRVMITLTTNQLIVYMHDVHAQEVTVRGARDLLGTFSCSIREH